MAEGTFRDADNRVPLWFPSELIAVEGNDEKILHVFSYGFPICAPEWSDSVQNDSQRVQAELPQLLILILVTLFQGNDLRKLQDYVKICQLRQIQDDTKNEPRDRQQKYETESRCTLSLPMHVFLSLWSGYL